MAVISVDRKQALAFRQRATHLHTRLPKERLLDASWAGLQDSVPRSALLALHARVEGVLPSAWKDPRFLQVWGPRGAVYVIPRDDVAVFTLGRLPRAPKNRASVERAADKVRKTFLARQGREDRVSSNRALDLSLRDMRLASITGAVRIEWDGSNTTWWIVEPPSAETEWVRLELARRFLRSVGPATPREFAWWSGVLPPDAQETFHVLKKELTEVELAGKTSWILRTDRQALERATPSDAVRLLPPGDPYLAAGDRGLLLPEPRFRSELWPRSVWPGAVLINGELVGTWRRQLGRVQVQAWRRLAPEARAAVEREAFAMPVESAKREVSWGTPRTGP